jgi:hypothetical protein
MFNLLSNHIPNLLRRLPSSAALIESVVCALWNDVVGEALARRTRPIRLQGTTLIVSVPSPVWQRELQPMRAEMVRKLEQRLGPGMVRQLEFKSDAAFDQEGSPQSAAHLGNPAAGLKLPTEDIQDGELRKRLADAAASYMAHQEAGLRKQAAGAC